MGIDNENSMKISKRDMLKAMTHDHGFTMKKTNHHHHHHRQNGCRPLISVVDTIVICLRYMMIAIGAATPGELPR